MIVLSFSLCELFIFKLEYDFDLFSYCLNLILILFYITIYVE